MAEVKLHGQIAQSGAAHQERVGVLLNHAAAQLRRESDSGPSRADAGELDLDADLAGVASGAPWRREPLTRWRLQAGRLCHERLQRAARPLKRFPLKLHRILRLRSSWRIRWV